MWILPTYLTTYLHYTIPILPSYMALSPFQVAFFMAHAHSKLMGSRVDDIRLFNIYDPRERLRIRRNGLFPLVVSISLSEDSHVWVDKGPPWLGIPQRKGDITIFPQFLQHQIWRIPGKQATREIPPSGDGWFQKILKGLL